MDERIKDNLKRLNRYRLLLEEISGIPAEKFAEDSINQYSAERYLQICIEICLNIGNRILALAQFSKPLFPPESYEDIVYQLSRLGMIDMDFKERFAELAKLRDELVHGEQDFEAEVILNTAKSSVSDFHFIQERVVEFLKKEGKQP